MVPPLPSYVINFLYTGIRPASCCGMPHGMPMLNSGANGAGAGRIDADAAHARGGSADPDAADVGAASIISENAIVSCWTAAASLMILSLLVRLPMRVALTARSRVSNRISSLCCPCCAPTSSGLTGATTDAMLRRTMFGT